MTPQELIAKHKITMDYTFVPFSVSRHKDNAVKSYNFKVRIYRDGVFVLTTDYFMGTALVHKPSIRSQSVHDRNIERKLIAAEIETGVRHKMGWSEMGSPIPTKRKIEPTLEDVIYSLTSDSDVLNYGAFEDWAATFGYDEDSRKAEKIYRECLSSALKLRNAFADTFFNDAATAFENY